MGQGVCRGGWLHGQERGLLWKGQRERQAPLGFSGGKDVTTACLRLSEIVSRPFCYFSDGSRIDSYFAKNMPGTSSACFVVHG